MNKKLRIFCRKKANKLHDAVAKCHHRSQLSS